MRFYFAFLACILPCAAAHAGSVDDISTQVHEQPVTQDPHGHMLTNNSVWSPDSQWLVYDTRKRSDIFDGTRIEAVNVRTGEVRCLYEARNGAVCGVVTYHPTDDKVIFILGPEKPSPDWSYGFSRRRGVIVDTSKPNEARPLDAENYAPPFAPGALRGGSHVHMFSGDGRLVSFTYDDEVLARLEDGDGHEVNQRNVGVATPARAVQVNKNHPRNNDGDYFSTLVTRTVNKPKPGSDEISRACEEGWIGKQGYQRSDGSFQPYALAFQGMVTAKDGSQHYEVFVVDLPADLTQEDGAPLQGTDRTRPAPPNHTVQRRLTFTDARKFPGIQGPRHWLRSSPDGSQIVFLMKDDNGVVQLWLISPNGGEPRQLTHNPWSVASALTWSPDGKLITYAMDNSIFVTRTTSGTSLRLTPRGSDEEAPRPEACVFSPDGKSIAYLKCTKNDPDKFAQIFVVSLPENLLPKAEKK